MRARSSWVWVLLLSSAPLLFSQTGSNPPVLRLDEHKMQILNGSQSRLELPVSNGTRHAVTAHVRVELLQPDDKIIGNKDLETSIAAGSHVLAFPWPIGLHSDSVSVMYWWRLRYSITPASGSDFPAQQGIVQISEIMSHLLRIQVASLNYVRPGTKFPLRVHVDDPRTGKSQSDVRIEAGWEPDDDQHKQLPPMQGKTDAHGNALFFFKAPVDGNDELSIDITAEKGSWITSKSIELHIRNSSTITVSTDKPIYQPGQVLHMRALVFGPDDHALAHATVKFKVSNEDSDDEFEVQASTSEFGVAQADWEIPRKVQLGDYRIRVEAGDRDGRGNAQVRISRYELPQFTVDPSTDKAFYLPGQQPKVEVKAIYLFGQQVKRGAVRVVRDNGRQWNADKKEYENDQKEVSQGELDSSGMFSTKLDVGEDFDDLGKADYQRYKDLRFAAYVTDLSTNRTEQRHFTVRISKDPIHIYVISNSYSREQPLNGYVMTALPDGTPASVDVTVSLVKPDKDDSDGTPSRRLELGHLHTNKYGVGYFHAKPAPADYWEEYGRHSSAHLLFEVSDRRIGKASHEEAIWLGTFPYLTVTPAATLLREGENVIADIESSLPDQDLFVDLLGQQGVLAWQTIPLRHGHAHAEFAYDDRFRNSLTIFAYTPYSDWQQQVPMSSAEVLFPEPQDLNLAVRMSRTTYKPGEPALAKFNVRSPDGSPAKGALGVVIYDKAVAERVRTDEEFGRYGFYFDNCPDIKR